MVYAEIWIAVGEWMGPGGGDEIELKRDSRFMPVASVRRVRELVYCFTKVGVYCCCVSLQRKRLVCL